MSNDSERHTWPDLRAAWGDAIKEFGIRSPEAESARRDFVEADETLRSGT
jgi:hypothetical protein